MRVTNTPTPTFRMKTMSLRILSAFLLCATFTLTACSRKPIDPTIPEALQDSNSNSEYSFELKSRESNDLVGELFAEILEKRPEVKKIVDEQIQMLDDIQQNINDLASIGRKKATPTMPQQVARKGHHGQHFQHAMRWKNRCERSPMES
ncbi:MAG: hypothetical protein IPN95_20935 [Bacteroidetes bacterium]|nr:hypothetical protein [Bacteroidota bacterium]